MKILLVGCGHMGASLLEAWAKAEIGTFDVLDPADVSVPEGCRHLRLAAELDGLYEVIILAVKPQMMESVCPGIVLHKAKGGLVVSIAAGTTSSTLKRLMGNGPTVRLMPTLPARIGMGISAVMAADWLPSHHHEVVEKLASAVGRYIWVEDDDGLDRFTAVAGSGPGYVFHLMEALANAAENQGFDPHEARLIADQVFAGSAALAKTDPSASLADLRQAVTSPGGTTEAGLGELRHSDRTFDLINRAVAAAVARARALG